MNGKIVENNTISKQRKSVRIVKIIGLVVLFACLGGLTVHALLHVFVKHYYPTYGQYRLFSIVSDSMEPTIPKGHMIVGRVPKTPEEIQVGDIITYEYTTREGSITLITHRVIDIRTDENGVLYTTRGDNAAGVDSVRPRYGDVVGVFNGKQCGFFGYFFGFLQSSEGAIALILVLMIVAIAYIVIHFINLVNTWRNIAVAALKKSGALLSGTQNENLVTIADVIGIVTKDPLDKSDVKRKDKKLHWFLKTGMLPKRPYSDDLDESAMTAMGTVEHIDVAPQPALLSTEAADGDVQIVTERQETMRYKYSFLARVIQLEPQAKEWYSQIKNELLSYRGIRVRSSNKSETFFSGRKAAARLVVRGKTLCLLLAIDPDSVDKKYRVERSKSGTPCLIRLKSARRVKQARQLIAELMNGLGRVKADNFEPKDYFLPYEGVVSLLQKDLVKRNLRSTNKTYRIEEITPDEPDGSSESSVADEALGKGK